MLIRTRTAVQDSKRLLSGLTMTGSLFEWQLIESQSAAKEKKFQHADSKVCWTVSVALSEQSLSVLYVRVKVQDARMHFYTWSLGVDLVKCHDVTTQDCSAIGSERRAIVY